MDLIMWSYFGT